MRRRWLRSRVAERVLVHTKTGKSIAGYLDEVGRDGILLRAVKLFLDDVDTPTPLDGELWIYERDIEFVQLGGTW